MWFSGIPPLLAGLVGPPGNPGGGTRTPTSATKKQSSSSDEKPKKILKKKPKKILKKKSKNT